MGSSTSMSLVKAGQIALSLIAPLGLDGELYPPQAHLKNNTSYDYIVVGAGTAGSIVATRLVENRKCNVLLLEAGDNPPIAALLPGLFYLLQGSYVDYKYLSTYDSYAASSQYNHDQVSAGKMLGGSASLNYFVHFRGFPSGFDYWAEVTGDDSWRYNNLLKYFLKSEAIHDQEIYEAFPEYHGTQGPTGLTRELHSDLNDYFKAFAEVGNPQISELNTKTPVGYAQPLYTAYKQVRQTPAITYIKAVKNYSNLHYSKKTRVTRIIFNDTVAVAVEAVHKGKKYVFRAKKEIILSAGTFGTPQLLMLSGVGPQDHLTAMNIKPKCDLPVGRHLLDTPGTLLVHKTKKYLLPLPSPKTVDVLTPTHIPFGIMIGSVALNKSQTTTQPDYRTYCVLFPHDSHSLPLGCANPFGVRKDICDNIQAESVSRDIFLCYLVNYVPKSRGKVCLKSTDPFVDPEITIGHYSNKKDLENTEKYIRDFLKVSKSTVFENLGAELIGLDVKECKDKKPGSRDFWKCYILHRSQSASHFAGTCAMGRVVDGNMKVKGLDKLRIVDASIIPYFPASPETSAVVMMLGEKAADLIKMGT